MDACFWAPRAASGYKPMETQPVYNVCLLYFLLPSGTFSNVHLLGSSEQSH